MALADITSTYRGDLIFKAYKKYLKKRQRVLDVGCGNGVIGHHLQKKTEIKILGCDIENYLVRDIPFILMKSTTKLPFKKQSFDVVMLNDMLHHTTYRV